MKRQIFILCVLAFIAMGCLNRKANKSNDTHGQTETVISENEIFVLDSTIAVIDSLNTDIEDSAKKLNKLLNNLN